MVEMRRWGIRVGRGESSGSEEFSKGSERDLEPMRQLGRAAGSGGPSWGPFALSLELLEVIQTGLPQEIAPPPGPWLLVVKGQQHLQRHHLLHRQA